MALPEQDFDGAVDADGYLDNPDPYETSISQEQSLALDYAVAVAPLPKGIQPSSLRDLCLASLRRSDSSALAQKLQPLLVR